MADKTLKSLTFPGLSDKYVIPDLEVDDTLTQQGKAADAKAVGDALTALESDISTMSEDIANKADIITDTATGAIASFPDGSNGLPLKSLVASIEPVQDLHGQDAPYPPGGGRNLLPMTLANMKSINTSGTWNGNIYALGGVSYAVNVDNGGNVESITVNGTATAYSLLRLCNNITFDVETKLRGCPASSYSGFKLQAEGNVSYQDIGNGVYIPENTALTRIIISFPSGISASNAVFYPRVIDMNASDQSFAPHSNECPISGWTGMNGQRTGKNLLDTVGRSITSTSGVPNTIYQNFCNVSKSGDVLTVTNFGTWGKARYIIAPDYLKVGQTYTVSAYFDNPDALAVGFCLRKNNAWTDTVVIRTTGEVSFVFTVAETDNITEIAILTNNSASAVSGTLVVSKIQLELGSTTTDYAVYSGESLSVSWQDTAGTVYGGTMTVNEDGSGVLSAEWAKIVFTSESQIGTSDLSSTSGAYVSLANDGFVSNAAVVCISSMAQGISFNNRVGSAYVGVDRCYIDSSGKVTLRSNNAVTYESKAEFLARFTGCELCYKLATPLVYHFDNLEQLTTLLGTNNIFVDCGQTTAEYRADTKLYIDKKLAAIVAALS